MKSVLETSRPARRNPLIRARDAIWTPTLSSLRLLALLGVLANAGIIVSGGTVRVTESGLGCPTWPKCTGDSLVPTGDSGHPLAHMLIEFGNRTLTFVVLAVGAAVFIAAWRLRPRRRDLRWLGAAQPLYVVLQAAVGGVVVLTELHPAAVSAHYLISPALLIFAVALWVRAGEPGGPVRPVTGPVARLLARALTVVTAAVLVAGTVVTGTGPHSGDADARRFGFEIQAVTRVHALLAWATVLLAAALMIVLLRTGAPRAARRRTAELLGVIVAQGAIGYAQYFLGVPPLLVVLHLLGSALLWIAALRVVFAMRVRIAAPAARARTAAVPQETPVA